MFCAFSVVYAFSFLMKICFHSNNGGVVLLLPKPHCKHALVRHCSTQASITVVLTGIHKLASSSDLKFILSKRSDSCASKQGVVLLCTLDRVNCIFSSPYSQSYDEK